MTPTPPQKLSAQRIANMLDREPTLTPVQLVRTALANGRRMTVVELCAATGISDSGVYRAIAAMGDELKAVLVPTTGRPSKVFALAHGSPKSASVRDKISAVLRGGATATMAEIADRAKVGRATIAAALKRDPRFVIVGERPTISGRRGGNKAAALWALAGTAPEVKRAPVARLGPEGPGRSEIRDSEGTPSDSHDYGAGIVSVAFEPSPETVQCAREPRTVALAACLDGYVNATATGRKSPCNQCPTGRARRAAYAGCDFEEEGDE